MNNQEIVNMMKQVSKSISSAQKAASKVILASQTNQLSIITRGMQEIFNKANEITKERYPKQVKVVDSLFASGWAIGNEGFEDVTLITDPDRWINYSPDDFNIYFSKRYANRRVLASDLKSVKTETVNDETLIAQCVRIIESDGDGWKVLYPQIFAMMDKSLLSQINANKIQNKNYTQSSRITKLVTKMSYSTMGSMITGYIYLKALKKATELWRFNKDTERPIPFTRNTIMHGKYSSDNYDYDQFAQLVLLFTTISIFDD
ncbi:hypothetical protein KGI31_12825 [Lactiplantibacillus pentosus]|uniref:hypothetical protein n=1 Tax=Lactiplantibacillus TaxID=2767842 RepID=UPI00080FA012|nr:MULTISPECIES: hypothetical protein [Lactiplantibacillus]MBG1236923.1 hypothetical protein [Lactiplantibacillus plantarum subsp. plantarum]MBU7497783.1 hypothetical protein [Lactiplantibacillus pentosus]WNN86524.1 hypothetical protein RNT80_06405 [Lactiplantibacillus pentosus]